MKWLSGQPAKTDDGYYLCAIVDHSQPRELFWDGSSWIYPNNNWSPLEDNEVAYYMNLSDIPMPEDW